MGAKQDTDDPGVPLRHLRSLDQCCGVAFHCGDCGHIWDVGLEEVIADLVRRGKGTEATGVREVASLARLPCPRCTGWNFSSQPSWAPGPR